MYQLRDLFSLYTIMEEKQKTFTKFEPAKIASQNSKAVLFQSVIDRNPQLHNKDPIDARLENLLGKLSYCDDIIHGPKKLFCVISDYFVHKSFRNQQHPESNIMICEFASCVFASQNDCTFAF